MAAETRRIQPGLYLMFMGETVTEDEIADQLNRVRDAAATESPDGHVLVIDCVALVNPLKAARVFPAHTHQGVTTYIVVNNNRSGAVFAERLAQKLSQATVEVVPTQPGAVYRAKDIRSSHDLEDLHHDYL